MLKFEIFNYLFLLIKLSPHAPFEFSFMDDRFEAIYRSDLQLKKAAGGAVIFITAFVLIAAQCLKTAMANPVRSLRSE